MLHFLGAFSQIRETFGYVAVIYVDFIVKNFSRLLLFMGNSATQPADKEGNRGCKTCVKYLKSSTLPYKGG
jgi:hypothetical protein